ncbi:vacuolar fusion protein CCZ1 homolog [Corticium candelabrum]|uniref:vacuolar fusion protein CCZ1 homolog n=1 Tax=Corticium candelabrum TaxID=121492 RepID=UPI002E3071E2|nr:vacuolar fusion protein CCZ1 homolog [Corticium candelabrum]
MARAYFQPIVLPKSEEELPKSVPTLVNFFVYNSTFGPKEGQEHEKVLFYMPDKETLDNKIRNIGLCEAMVQFTRKFSPHRPCEAVHTQKRKQLLFQAEPEYWMVMTVSLPGFEARTKDDKPVVEYREEEVQDAVYTAVLKHTYKMFRLFNSTFERIFDRQGKEGLKHRLAHFFLRYVNTIRLPQLDLLDIYQGIQFLPLDKQSFLKIQSFVNLVEQTFSQIKYTAFLYTDQLVWSGLEQEDMRVLYKYLTTSLFPLHFSDMETFASGMNPPPSRQAGRDSSAGPPPHPGWFMVGPRDLRDPKAPINTAKIFVNTETEMEELHLIVYHATSATVCFMVTSSIMLTYDFCKTLDGFVGPQLGSLGKMISDQLSKRIMSSDVQYRFIYFNHMNLAQKSTVHLKRPPSLGISHYSMRLICDISADFSRSEEDGETIMKTAGDYWVVAKRSDQREFYIILHNKSANLIEVNEEVKRMCAMHFNNIFFLD